MSVAGQPPLELTGLCATRKGLLMEYYDKQRRPCGVQVSLPRRASLVTVLCEALGTTAKTC